MNNNELHGQFQGLEFEPEEHVYTLNGKKLMSVSDSYKPFYEEFDTDQKAIEYAERHGGDPVEIAARWRQTGKEAADFGTSVHTFGEKYLDDNTLQPSNNHEKAVVSFWNDMRMYFPYIIPISAEFRVYDETLRKAGTIDILLWDDIRKGIIIADYKTNKDLYKNFMGKTMLEPFTFMLDMPLSHYELQLSTYQLILKRADIKVIERWIIWLKPDADYEVIKARDFSVQLEREYLIRM